MWMFWFLTCCIAARQKRDDGSAAIKKKVKKYKMWELNLELFNLGVHLDEDSSSNEKKSRKKMKHALQKRLISELLKIHVDRANKRAKELLMSNPNVMTQNVLNYGNASLESKLEQMENDNKKMEGDGQSVLHTLMDNVEKNNDNTDGHHIILEEVESTLNLTLISAEHLNNEIGNKMPTDDVNSIRAKASTGEGDNADFNMANDKV
ncbi:hypothetical protein AALO_G00276450 [Alosa alosa]|uniref:Uncharacterized protein n=1 Tax=Alosa alosa TaxID=278164 RepID=A0AAV6FIC3_9TELE|nr:uncharacterized protein LOC125287692 [Alosa alosa]KAG5262563.1 hypothetical protein AALO_G00276450 [Alosa alosa]